MDPAPENGSEHGTVAVIGGGIVGLATAYALTRRGRIPVVLEKEPALARHQTGRNSGVIHSGIYYAPGSAKATLCRTGRAALLDFCEAHDIEHDVCGKVIVATRSEELPQLDALHERGEANGIEIRRLDGGGLREREPHAAGIAALEVADAGIVDYAEVCRVLAELIVQAGGLIRTGVTVTSARPIASSGSAARSGRATTTACPASALSSPRTAASSTSSTRAPASPSSSPRNGLSSPATPSTASSSGKNPSTNGATRCSP